MFPSRYPTNGVRCGQQAEKMHTNTHTERHIQLTSYLNLLLGRQDRLHSVHIGKHLPLVCQELIVCHLPSTLQIGVLLSLLVQLPTNCTYMTYVYASSCVVECRICDREVAGSNLGRGYFAPRSTQPSTPPGSVNEYQL